MRTVITNYTFNKATKQVTLSDFGTVSLSNLFLIVDVTNGVTIFQANDPTLGATASSNVFSLTYDTTGGSFNNSDALQIFYEVSPLSVSAASLPLPTGASTSALQTTGNSSLSTVATNTGNIPAKGAATTANSTPVNIASDQTSTVPAVRGSRGVITTPAPQSLFRSTFASAIGSGVDSNFFTVIQTGSGQAVSQSGGNLLLTSGTTANAETIIRSNSSFSGSLVAKIQSILSQRIINNNFYVELVDVIGDALAVTVNSATSITVTIPSNPFTSANVGQSMYVGAVQNISATAIPGRFPIASVSGNNVNFTVAGWPASGSGTCSLFGWNYYQLLYTSTTATNASFDAQRRGYNSGFTVTTINTTASPGHLAVMTSNDGNAYFADQLIASVAGTVQLTQRASRVVNLAEESTSLFLQLRAANGSTAPASTTTWTVGSTSVENYAATAVVVNDVKPLGPGNQIPVAVTNTPAVTVSSGTVTTVTTVTTVAAVTAASLAGASATDIASAAITTTLTSAGISIANTQCASFNVAVTVVSGTTPTLDVVIQETVDGTNWYDIYHFERFTTTGFLSSPKIRLAGTQIRYIRTVSGTTPSFTNSVVRFSRQTEPATLNRRIFDRAISPSTASSNSAAINCEGTDTLQALVVLAAGGSNPSIQFQVSEDNANWASVGTTTACTVGSTTAIGPVISSSKFARLTVTSAGAGSTLTYVGIRAL